MKDHSGDSLARFYDKLSTMACVGPNGMGSVLLMAIATDPLRDEEREAGRAKGERSWTKRPRRP